MDATLIGSYWFYMITEAVVTVIEQAGLAPDDTPIQFRDALRKIYGEVEAGTRMVFYQAAAPTGWTKVSSVNDRLLRVVSGDGGGTGGDWRISGLSVGGTALTVDQVPEHSHGAGTLGADSAGEHRHTYNQRRESMDAQAGSGDTNASGTNNRNTSSDGEHMHQISGSTGSAGGGQPHLHSIDAGNTWRPQYIDVIVCERA